MPPAEGPDLSSYGYVHVAHIGRGQYANAQVVKKGADQLVAKTVSLENLNAADQKLSHQEVSLLQRLSHPHIVAYRESFLLPDNNTLVIVMEHCEGGDLRQLVKTKSKAGCHFPENQIMHWFVQCARALSYIHAQKILHRDLKTSNIFLSNITTVKLGDFGISRVLDTTTEAAVTVVGTPYYMSPEVCRSEPYNFKSDVWALGCVLYELCMLKHAFESKSLLGLVYKIVSDHYDPVPDFYSANLNELIRRLLAKKPDSRPTLVEVLEDPYIATVEDGTLEPSSPIRAPPSLRPQERKGPSSPAKPPTNAAKPETVAPEVFMARVRRQLVSKKLNWMSAFAGFDAKGDGMLPESAFTECLTGLGLSLSGDELKVLADWLSEDKLVSLSKFAEHLDKAPEAGALSVQRSARRLLGAKVKALDEACVSQDSEKNGVLSAPVFQDVLRIIVPEISQRDVTNMVLVAEKNLSGDVDYVQVVTGLREPPPPPLHGRPPPPRSDSKNPAPPNLPPLPPGGELGEATFHTCHTSQPGGPFQALSKEGLLPR